MQALLCLPPEEQKTYESFLHSPLLLVEELFIDSKIEWAGKVIGQLRANEHLSNISTVDTPILERRLVMPGEVQGEEERDNDPFTTLLMFYCDKALEFPQSTVVLKTPAECESMFHEMVSKMQVFEMGVTDLIGISILHVCV